MTVLILTSQDDVTADLVVKELTETNKRVHRVSLDDTLTVSGLPGGEITVRDPYRETADPSAVYWRRPGPVASEPAKALVGLLRARPELLWVNHPDRNETARHKPPQIVAARACGFTVPATVFGNGRAVESFIRDFPDHIIKPLHQEKGAFVPLGQGMIYQQRIRKRYDIRLTVVGKHVFACRITSNLLDWRGDEEAEYNPTIAPQEVIAASHRYMKHYGLNFGAFDFAVSGNGTWYFLECNPNGQFGFVEGLCGLPISHALADLLTSTPQPAHRSQ